MRDGVTNKRRGMRVMAAGVVLVLGAAGTAMAQLVAGWQVTNSVASGVVGELHLPAGYDSSKSYPIVLFLHGSGEEGSNNTSQVSTHISNLVANADSHGFFVYAPQTGAGGWSASDQLIAVAENLARLTTQYNIDPNRIYVTGLSLGGGATDDCLAQYPNLFAAFVPLSPVGGISSATAATAVNRPVWYFHGQADANPSAGVSHSRDAVNAILAAQAHAPLTSWSTASIPTFKFSYNNINYTEYYSGGHNDVTWNNGAYSDASMYSWLLNQRNTNSTLAAGKSLNVAFTAGWTTPTIVDTQHRTWNFAGAGATTGYDDPNNPDVTVAFAQDSSGQQTTVGVMVTKSFNGGANPIFPGGQKSLSSLYDSFVTDGNWRVTSSQGDLTFFGLTPGGKYSLQIFASINDTDGGRRYVGNYAVGGTSVIFDAAQNLTDLINLNNLIADSKGNLVLSVTPTNGSEYAVLSGLTLTAAPVPEPAGLTLLGILGVAATRRRR